MVSIFGVQWWSILGADYGTELSGMAPIMVLYPQKVKEYVHINKYVDDWPSMTWWEVVLETKDFLM